MQAKPILIAALAFALTGCLAQSKIQGRYMEAQDQCRAEAQSRVPAASTATNATGSPDDPNIALAKQFSECMNKLGWHVAAPKPTTPLPPTAQNNPPAIFPNQPLAVDPSHTTAARALAVQQPTPVHGDATAAPILGPGVQPNPPAATAPANSPMRAVAPQQALQPLTPTPQPPAPATYLPGRPGYSDDNGYGSGAGRQF